MRRTMNLGHFAAEAMITTVSLEGQHVYVYYCKVPLLHKDIVVTGNTGSQNHVTS
jgi:hypothetical protein